MNLAYHIHAGVRKWSPTSAKIESTKGFVRNYLHEKTGIKLTFRISKEEHQPLEMWQGNVFPQSVINQITISDGY